MLTLCPERSPQPTHSEGQTQPGEPDARTGLGCSQEPAGQATRPHRKHTHPQETQHAPFPFGLLSENSRCFKHLCVCVCVYVYRLLLALAALRVATKQILSQTQQGPWETCQRPTPGWWLPTAWLDTEPGQPTMCYNLNPGGGEESAFSGCQSPPRMEMNSARPSKKPSERLL